MIFSIMYKIFSIMSYYYHAHLIKPIEPRIINTLLCIPRWLIAKKISRREALLYESLRILLVTLGPLGGDIGNFLNVAKGLKIPFLNQQ